MVRPLSDFEDMAYRALLSKEKQYAEEVRLILVDALNKIRIEMARVYEKYSVDGILTKAEMTKYNRLATLEKEIMNIVKPAASQVAAILNRVPPDMYGESFFRYAWSMDMGTQVALTWGPLNRESVIENLANPIDKIAVQKYKATAPIAARQALNSGLIAGQSYVQMMRDFKKFVNASNFEAMRILRTEGQTAQNAAQADVYLKARAQGIEGRRRWDAALDGRTRPTHGAADGTFENAEGMFKVGGEKTPYPAWEGLSAAERINCRCFTHFEIEGFSPAVRRTRDEGLIPYMTYSEWKEERKTWR